MFDVGCRPAISHVRLGCKHFRFSTDYLRLTCFDLVDLNSFARNKPALGLHRIGMSRDQAKRMVHHIGKYQVGWNDGRLQIRQLRIWAKAFRQWAREGRSAIRGAWLRPKARGRPGMDIADIAWMLETSWNVSCFESKRFTLQTLGFARHYMTWT